MKPQKEDSNILQYKQRKHLNIGLVIFGIIFIYLIATIVMYLTTPHITIYEVREGSILNDTAYTGLVIRDEMVVYSEGEGYINYFANDKSKVRVGSKIYALSDRELEMPAESSADTSLTKEQQRMLLTKMHAFNESFQENAYADTYVFKNEIVYSLRVLSNGNYQEQIEGLLASNTYNYNSFSSQEDGVVVWNVDGMEDLTIDQVTAEHLSKANYSEPEILNNTKIQSGTPVYKLLTGEKWTVIIEIDSDINEQLKERKYVKVHFDKDDQSMWADLEIKTVNGHYLAYLSFDDCIRYVGDRFLDIELILEDETGLKIPKSAVTEKDFFIVPLSYITQGGNTKKDGVLRQSVNKKGEKITEFLAIDIYYQGNEMAYLDPNAFDEGDILLKPDSSETYPLSETRSLKGAYNINKGYVVFKQIKILCENEEYYIVEAGSSYGLSNYDHIVLDASVAKENDVVF